MRQPTAALGVAVICILIAGCGSTKGSAGSTTTTRSMIPRPLVERELAGLLLSPDQVNAAMGATAMTVTNTQTSMSDNSATMAQHGCAGLAGDQHAALLPDTVERHRFRRVGDAEAEDAVVLVQVVERVV